MATTSNRDGVANGLFSFPITNCTVRNGSFDLHEYRKRHIDGLQRRALFTSHCDVIHEIAVRNTSSLSAS